MDSGSRRRAVLWLARLVLGFLVAATGGNRDAVGEFALVPPAKDATLIEDPGGALSNGAGPAIFAGRINLPSLSIRRAVLAFDIAGAIPQGSIVTRAVLRLSMSATSAGAVPVGLHRLLADWGEGASASSGGGGVPSAPGDSTWIHRFYDDVFWMRQGGDFDPIPGAVTLVDQFGVYAWGPTPEMAADVQSWLDHPEIAYGWLLAGDEANPQTVKRFDSREHPEAALRPILEVEYVPPCSPDFAGPGHWQRQCSSLMDGGGASEEPSDPPGPREPGFSGWVVPCARRTLSDLGLPEVVACDAVLAPPPPTCRERAERMLAVLVLNVCAGRLQTSCPVEPEEDGCAAPSVGDLLLEVSALIRAGDCRLAAGCAGSLD